MKIALIGRGRLATNLLPALQQAGHDVTSVHSRTLEQLPHGADVYIISVKDSALQGVIKRVADSLATENPTLGVGQGRAPLLVHTAGSMPVSVFEGYTSRYGVLYPMQTFSKERRVDFRAIPIFIETNGESHEGAETAGTLRRLAESISSHVYELSSEQRRQLHLAAVFACNFANHCYALSADILARAGLPFDVMLPLVDETARKVHELHPLDAQTGPSVRYDENVIGMQSQLLADRPAMQRIYQLLSQSIHETAIQHDQLRLTEDTSHRV